MSVLIAQFDVDGPARIWNIPFLTIEIAFGASNVDENDCSTDVVDRVMRIHLLQSQLLVRSGVACVVLP